MKQAGRRAAPDQPFRLPALDPFDGDDLEAGHDYEAIEFVDRDFTGQDAIDARFLACRLERCLLDGLSMRRARFVGSLLDEVRGASIDFTDSTWRDSLISGGRLGAVVLVSAAWDGVRVRGSKLDFVNLAGGQVEDVIFERCEIGSLDLRGARLRSVSFVDCSLNELNVSEATLSKVDLSGARLHTVIGVDNLRGAKISHEQLIDLAPLLAAQLGLEVRPSEPEPSRPDVPD